MESERSAKYSSLAVWESMPVSVLVVSFSSDRVVWILSGRPEMVLPRIFRFLSSIFLSS